MDSGDNAAVRYSLAGRGSEAFVIDPVTGIVRVSDIGVDFESIPENPLMVNVIASDLGMKITRTSFVGYAFRHCRSFYELPRRV